MRTVKTNNFEQHLYNMLSKYSGQKFNLMISGGSLLDCLKYPSYADLDTTQWKIFFADERCDQQLLNYTASMPFIKMISGKVLNIETSLPIIEAVEQYSNKLENIDIALLGIGNDGHICSLFPDSVSLDSCDKVVYTRKDGVESPDRITVTLCFINNYVRDLFFVVPSKNGKIKDVRQPHKSIVERIEKDFLIILDSRVEDQM